MLLLSEDIQLSRALLETDIDNVQRQKIPSQVHKSSACYMELVHPRESPMPIFKPDGQQAAELTTTRIAALTERFMTNSKHRLAQNAVTQTSADDVALNRSIVTKADFSFSTTLDNWTVTNQKNPADADVRRS